MAEIIVMWNPDVAQIITENILLGNDGHLAREVCSDEMRNPFHQTYFSIYDFPDM